MYLNHIQTISRVGEAQTTIRVQRCRWAEFRFHCWRQGSGRNKNKWNERSWLTDWFARNCMLFMKYWLIRDSAWQSTSYGVIATLDSYVEEILPIIPDGFNHSNVLHRTGTTFGWKHMVCILFLFSIVSSFNREAQGLIMKSSELWIKLIYAMAPPILRLILWPYLGRLGNHTARLCRTCIA